MREFEAHNPIVLLIYYILTVGIGMSTHNPAVLLLAFAGAFFSSIKYISAKSHIWYIAVFILFTVTNPLFYHDGKNVLFILNDNPITLEAFAYGMVTGLMICGVLYRFRHFQRVMTADKLMYVFGKISPKLATVLSMTLRYIPLFRNQYKTIKDTQTALGLYKEDNVITTLYGNMRVLSVLVTWALENGIVTAQSMEGRGFGTGKRTYYSLYSFTRGDVFLLVTELMLSVAPIYVLVSGKGTFAFYPELMAPKYDVQYTCALISFFFLSFLPVISKTIEELRWKYLESKI